MTRVTLKSTFFVALLSLIYTGFPKVVYSKEAKVNILKRINVKSTGSSTTIYLKGTKPATFSAYRLNSPPGIVIELSQTRAKKSISSVSVDSWAVSQVTTRDLTEKNSLKVTVLLARRGSFRVVSRRNTVEVIVTSFQPFPENVVKAGKKLSQIKKEFLEMEAKLKIARRNVKNAEKKAKNAGRYLKITAKQRKVLDKRLATAGRQVKELIKKKVSLKRELRAAKQEMKMAKQEKNEALKRYKKIENKVLILNKKRRISLRKLKSINGKIALSVNKRRELVSKISSIKKELNNLRKHIVFKENSGEKVKLNIKRRLWALKSKLAKSEKVLSNTNSTIWEYNKKISKIKKITLKEEKKLALMRKEISLQKLKYERKLRLLKHAAGEMIAKKNSLIKDLNVLQKMKANAESYFKKEKKLAEKYKRERIKNLKFNRKLKKLNSLEIVRAKAAEEKSQKYRSLVKNEKKHLRILKNIKSKELAALKRLRLLRAKHKRLLAKEKLRLIELRKRGNTKEAKSVRRKQISRLRTIKRQREKARRLEKRVLRFHRNLANLEKKIERSKSELQRARLNYNNIQLEVTQISSAKDLVRNQLRITRAALESTRIKSRVESKKLSKLKRRSKLKRQRLFKISKKLTKMSRSLRKMDQKKRLKSSELRSLVALSSALQGKVVYKKGLIKKLETKKRNLEAQLKSLVEKKRYLSLKNKRLSRKNHKLADKEKRVIKQELKSLKKQKLALLNAISKIKRRREKIMKMATLNSSPLNSKIIINKVDFIDSPWSHQVVISYKGSKATPRVLHKGKLLTLMLSGARMREKLMRKVNTEAYKGPISKFITWNRILSGKNSSEAVLKVYTRGVRKAQIRKSKGKIIILIPKSIAEIRRYKNRSHTVAPTRVAGYLTSVKKVSSFLPLAPGARNYRRYSSKKRRRSRRYRRRSRRYRGRFVDLDFKDADIHNVIRLVSEVWGRNVVIPDSVKGTVSIKLTNVRVDRAFDVILKSKGLAWNYEGGNIIRVITAEQQKKEREDLIARTRTKVKLIKTETRLIPINYANAEKLAKAIKDNVKSNRGKVTFDKRTNVIIYVDIPSKLAVAQKLIKSLDMPTPQVQIEARIVEAESTFLREIGVQWGGSLLATSSTGNPTGLIFPSNIGLAGGNMDIKTNASGVSSAGAANPDFAVNLPASVGQGSGGALGMTLGSLAGAVNINLRISAMEEIGHVRSISAPKITTLDNVEATISQGVEIPYPQSSAQGNTVIMKQAVLSLSVTPHVTNDNMVKLKIKVTKDEPDETHRGADGSLGIAKKSANTELLVKSGDTAVIGGIYKRQSTLVYRKIPWFADIPILGWLFKSQYKKDARSELLIFITPRVLNRSGVISK